MTLFVDPAGIGAASPTAPGMQSQVNNWMNTGRQSIGQLVKDGMAAAPKAPIPPTPGVTAVAETVASRAAPSLLSRVAAGASGPLGLAAYGTIEGMLNNTKAYNTDPRVQAIEYSNVGTPTWYKEQAQKTAIGQPPSTTSPAPGVNSIPVAKIEQPDFMSQPGKGNDLTLPSSKPGQPVTTPTSAPGVTRTQAIGSNVPLYSNMENPTAGFNTTPGLNGNVGNLSVIGADKAAIDRGTAATKDLNDYKEAMMRAKADGGSPEDYLPGGARSGGPHGASLGGGAGDALQRALQSPFANVREQALATQSQQQAQANQQRQFDASQAIAQGNLSIGQQRLALDEAQHAPGIQTQQQIAKLNSAYLSLNDQNDPDGAKRKAMASQILTMQGKTPQPKFTSHVVDQFGTDAMGNTVRTGQALVNVDQNGKVSAVGADGKPFGSNVLQGEQRKAAIADAQIALKQGHPPEEIARRLRSAGIDPKETGAM